MNTLDTYTHYHSGATSSASLSSNYYGYHLIQMHSISFFFSFKNIAAQYGNNVFFYAPNSSIVIPDGAYSITSFNKYISDVGATQLYKVTVSRNGLNLVVKSYST